MEDMLRVLNWADAKLKEVKENSVTYEIDMGADWEDGKYSGKIEMLEDIMKYCIQDMAKRYELN